MSRSPRRGSPPRTSVTVSPSSDRYTRWSVAGVGTVVAVEPTEVVRVEVHDFQGHVDDLVAGRKRTVPSVTVRA